MSGNKFQQRSKALIDRTYVAHRISLIQEVVAIGDDILLRLKKNQERGHRGPTECHELPLSTSSGSVHLFFECTLLRGVGTRILARDTEEESSGYSVVEYLFAPIGLLREASQSLRELVMNRFEEIDNQILLTMETFDSYGCFQGNRNDGVCFVNWTVVCM